MWSGEPVPAQAQGPSSLSPASSGGIKAVFPCVCHKHSLRLCPAVSAEGRRGPQDVTPLQTGLSFSQNCPSCPVPGLASAPFCCPLLPVSWQCFGWKGGGRVWTWSRAAAAGAVPCKGNSGGPEAQPGVGQAGEQGPQLPTVGAALLSLALEGKAQGCLFCLPALHGRGAGHVESRLRVPQHHHHLGLRRRIRHLPQGWPRCLPHLPALRLYLKHLKNEHLPLSLHFSASPTAGELLLQVGRAMSPPQQPSCPHCHLSPQVMERFYAQGYQDTVSFLKRLSKSLGLGTRSSWGLPFYRH